jgi:hypothetical protein
LQVHIGNEAGIQRVEISCMETDIITRRPPPTRRAAIVGMCVALLAATACSNSGPTGVACSQVYVYGISLKVQNAVTGARITDSTAVQIKDGGYVESYNYLGPADQPTSGVLSVAGERAGTYNISIRKDGFAPYDTAGIKVTRDVCHVHGVQVTANLQPAAGG